MKRARFIEERRADWKRFEELIQRAEKKRVPDFRGEEVSEFSRLLRAVCYDLATVRSRDWGSGLYRYLNHLVARGHNNYYRSPPGRPLEVLRFFSRGFPRLLRENAWYFWAALALFVVPGLVSGYLIVQEPSRAQRILPGSQLEMFEQMYSGERDADERVGESYMAGVYVYNNVGIAFRCFATGVLFGAGTVFFLVYNSIYLGAVTAYLTVQGHSERFYSFVISHGSFELTAIVIAGAAGLILGHALVHPGQQTRLASLVRRGGDAIRLAAGAGAMLGVAALIEAFWSPSGAPAAWKYAVGGGLWLAVILYLTLAGRDRSDGLARGATGAE